MLSTLDSLESWLHIGVRSSVCAIIRGSDELIVCVHLYDENVPKGIAHSVTPFLD